MSQKLFFAFYCILSLLLFQYDGSNVGGWPGSTSGEGDSGGGGGNPNNGIETNLPPTSMYGGGSPSTPSSAAADHRAALDHIAAQNAAAAAHMAAGAAANNPYAAVAAAVNHMGVTAAGSPGGAGQVPDVHKRDKDAIYGWVRKNKNITCIFLWVQKCQLKNKSKNTTKKELE